MKKIHTQKGFTLVELAIVMTIIGLLIGGILKGQELMQNARVTSTIAQVRSYEAATTTFRDKYNAFPGDLANAGTTLPNCPVAVDCTPLNTGAGNSVVGAPAWTGTAASEIDEWPTQLTGIVAPTPPAAAGDETYLFWAHLLLADLISGITDAGVTGGDYAFNTTHPGARIGGGFIVGWGSGGRTPGNPIEGAVGPTGLILALLNGPTNSVAADATGQEVLTPTRAAQIDRKMDDGRPNTGYVHAFGTTDSCFNVDAPNTDATPGYLENVQSNDCGLVFRIQG